MQTKNKHVVIIGGGAAGMMAGIHALRHGARVTLLEKNEKLGKKIYITGKGRCNVTNACSDDELMRSFPRNPRFLYAALRYFSPQDMMALLDELDCPTVIERGQRVYPASQKASDITRALQKALKDADIRLGAEADSITLDNNAVTQVLLKSGESIPCDALIVATGGLSYAVTGSTGDGYRFAKMAGHTLIPTTPSLVPIELSDTWIKSLQGLSLKNVKLTLKINKKKAFEEQGEMLFTHFGISGPLVLSASCHISGSSKHAELFLDLKPALQEETLLARLKKDIEQQGKKHLHTLLQGYMPMSLSAVFPAVAGLEPNASVCYLTLEERRRLIQTMKAIPLNIKGLRGYAEAVVTRGGVDVKTVNPSTMQSKCIPNLYFAGEVLDVDGYTGGFNLQIAFSTGALAGQAAALAEN